MTAPDPDSIRNAILARYAAKLPLNLSAVHQQAPELLAGLWDPKTFKTWRQRLADAGVDCYSIRHLLAVNAVCPICGFQELKLAVHFAEAHASDAATMRQLYPFSECVSEESRARLMSRRHGKASQTIVPHWEKAWSKEYGMDRVRWLYDNGHPVSYAAVAKREPGLAGYIRRIFGSWDAGLEACGIDPSTTRLAILATSYTRDEVLAELRRLHVEMPNALLLHKAKGISSALRTAAFREFHTYEDALTAAGIDPAPILPALQDPALVAQRAEFLEALRERYRRKPPYEATVVAAFIKTYDPVVTAFWGDWNCVHISQGWVDGNLFNAPPFTKYRTTRSIIRAIAERKKLGMPMRQAEVRIDNSPLLNQAVKLFGTWPDALKAAGTELPPRMLKLRHYTPESLLEHLRNAAAAGTVMWSTSFMNKKNGIVLKWVARYFGTWENALAQAGIERPKRPPSSTAHMQRPPKYDSDESILKAIQLRSSQGLSMIQKDLTRNLPEGGDLNLLRTAIKRWGTWGDALVVAGICKIGDRVGRRRFWNQETVLVAMRKRLQEGKRMISSAMSRGPERDVALVNAISRYFTSHNAAVAAAKKADFRTDV
jgi:hypothetical protein